MNTLGRLTAATALVGLLVSAGSARADRAADCEALRVAITESAKTIAEAIRISAMVEGAKKSLGEAGVQNLDTPEANRWFLYGWTLSKLVQSQAQLTELPEAVEALGRVCYGKR